MLALEHSPRSLFARLAKGYASYATYACHHDAKVMGVHPREICPTESEVVQAVTEGFTQGMSRGLGLDPFYEMFPTTRRQSYPWWRYSYGLGGLALDPVITQVAAQEALETNCPQRAPIATCKSFLTRPVGSIPIGTNETETVGCCFFNAFKANDDALARQLLTVLDATAKTTLLTNFAQAIPESAAFLARVQAPPGLSTKTKIAIGVGVGIAALGAGAFLFARR